MDRIAGDIDTDVAGQSNDATYRINPDGIVCVTVNVQSLRGQEEEW